ncbi:AAA family ATPase [Hymenobacter gummosus]|nr:AAA family ATPase [Hymenobacter gummosus]
MSESEAPPQVPRLTYLRIRNYRALRDVELRDLTPLTVLVGPNGSGKSTMLDALAFLAEAVAGNLQQAWEKRNRFAGMRTRGSEGPIEFEVHIPSTNNPTTQLAYTLEFVEAREKVLVLSERLSHKDEQGIERLIFDAEGSPESVNDTLDESSMVDVTIYPSQLNGNLNQFGTDANSLSLPFIRFYSGGSEFEEVVNQVFLFIKAYRYIHLTDNHTKGVVDAGPRERLSPSGDNLPNVLYYLQQKHPEVLQGLIGELRRQVPALAEVLTEVTSDERLLLRFRDAPFEKPLPAQYMSDGTLRLTALLTLLREPEAAGLLGLEEPENELHPRLLPRLAEELRRATETRQLLVATHSPALLDALEPAQVWILHRGPDGYTQATRVADLPDVVAMVEEGSPLGYLWERNFFDVGDPLAPLSPQPIRE